MASDSGNNPLKYSDLVQSDDSIEKLITQLNELRATYTRSLREIRQEAVQLSTQLRTVSGATQQGQRVTRTTVVETDRLSRSQSALRTSMSDSAVELARLRNVQREQNNINRATARLNDSLEGSYNQLSAQYSLNAMRLNRMTREMRDNTEEGRRLTDQTRDLREEMMRIQDTRANRTMNVGNYTNGIRDALEELQGQFGSSLMNLQNGGEGFSAVLQNMGTSIVAFGRTLLGLLANPVFLAIAGIAAAGAAFRWWYDYNVGLIEATKLTKQFTDLSGSDLTAMRNEVQATADIFNKDFKEVLIASNAVAKQFGISQQEAIKLVQDGFIAGGDANGEYLDSLREYPAYFKEAGLSASQFIAITTNGAKGGVFSDKAPDTIKELNDRLREMPKATADALQAIGISYKQTQKDLQDGTKTTFEVAQEVAEKLKDIPESSALMGQVLTNVFGEVGKDAGLQFIKTLVDMDTNLDNLKANAGDLGKAQAELLESNAELANVTSALFDSTGGLFELIIARGKVFANNVLIAIVKGMINVANWGIKIYNNTIALRTAVQGVIAAFQILWETIKLVFNLISDVATAAGDALASLFALDIDGFNAAMRKFIKSQETALRNYAKSSVSIIKKGLSNIGDKLDPIVIPVLTTGDATVATPTKGKKAAIVTYDKKPKKEKEVDPNTIYRKNLELQRKYEDSLVSLISDSFDKRRQETIYKYKRESEDLQYQLKTEKDLTVVGKNAIMKTISTMEERQTQELAKIESERQVSSLEQQKTGIQLQLDAVKKGSDAEYKLKLDLIEKERLLELAQNKLKPVNEQKSEDQINAKYTFDKSAVDDEFLQLSMTRFDALQAMEQSEFDLLKNSEARKTKFKLEQERKRWQKLLEINEQMGNKLSDNEVKTIQANIKKIDGELGELKSGKSQDIYDLMGFNLSDDQKEAISETTSFVMDQLNQILSAKLAAAEQAVTAADKEVDSAEKILDSELEARANGYANNVVMAQKEFDAAKKNQEKANKEKAKVVKQQQALDTIAQTSSLITASAGIWSSMSTLGPAGPFLAAAALALMWGSFAYSKIKARQISKTAGSESYGDGTVELLGGGSHQSGNDVDLGTKPDGTKRRAEGGEYFAVINKRSSRKYRRVIPDVVKSFNNGSFAQKYLGAYNDAKNVSVNVSGDNPDFSQIKDDVSEIKNRKRYVTDGNGNTVEIYKNLKRTIVR